MQIKIGKLTIEGSNHKELLIIKKEIFDESAYYVDFDTDNPTIIDCGAHLGLATIYFKHMWPRSQVTAVEPHPQNISFLKQNLWLNNIKGVEIIEAAVDQQVGERYLHFDPGDEPWLSTASFIEGAWTGQEKTISIKVPTITLDSILTKPIDLLKIDIEGAEESVLKATKNLYLVKNLIVETHPQNKPKKHPLEAILQKQGFTTKVEHTGFGLYRITAFKK